MEHWRKIPDHEPYEVSNFGRVRNSYRMLKPRLYGVGYYGVNLNQTEVYIHRAVAAAFLGKIPAGYHVNHLDGNRINNHLHNLEICTPKQNSQHAHARQWYKTQLRIFDKITNRSNEVKL